MLRSNVVPGLTRRAATQLFVLPRERFILHGDRPAVRFVVKLAEELIDPTT